MAGRRSRRSWPRHSRRRSRSTFEPAAPAPVGWRKRTSRGRTRSSPRRRRLPISWPGPTAQQVSKRPGHGNCTDYCSPARAQPLRNRAARSVRVLRRAGQPRHSPGRSGCHRAAGRARRAVPRLYPRQRHSARDCRGGLERGVRVRQFVDEGLGNSAHLLISERDGVAALIDPLRDVDQYQEVARREGVRITHVCETHIHNDFVSGSRELAAGTGARIVASADAGLEFDH
ncbi:MAG: MBL fold metallo-hydrolase, partial [Chloroflexi bacterium]